MDCHILYIKKILKKQRDEKDNAKLVLDLNSKTFKITFLLNTAFYF